MKAIICAKTTVINTFYVAVERRRCCVSFCAGTEKTLYRFPDPKNSALFRAWLVSVGNQDLLEKDPDLVHRRRFVCKRHFQSTETSTLRLITGAIPTLFLPGKYVVYFKLVLAQVSSSEFSLYVSLFFFKWHKSTFLSNILKLFKKIKYQLYICFLSKWTYTAFKCNNSYS